MGIQVTLVLYAVIGGGVAATLCLRRDEEMGATWFQMLTAGLFWPLYVPLLLSRPPLDKHHLAPTLGRDDPRAADRDEAAAMIECVEAELHAALEGLEGWAELTFAGERARIDELQLAWRSQAERIRELTRLLDAAALEPDGEAPTGDRPGTVSVRILHSADARRANLRRLREIHDQMQEDLLSTLAWVRELVTMIHLARYTGAPASRAEELVAQIAAAVEGLQEVSAHHASSTTAISA